MPILDNETAKLRIDGYTTYNGIHAIIRHTDISITLKNRKTGMVCHIVLKTKADIELLLDVIFNRD